MVVLLMKKMVACEDGELLWLSLHELGLVFFSWFVLGSELRVVVVM